MTYVMAANYAQYRHYCEENDLRPMKDARYVSSIQVVSGVRWVGWNKLIRLEGWTSNPLYTSEFLQELEARTS